MDNPAQMTDMEVRERVIKLEAIIRGRDELINNAVSSRIAELEKELSETKDIIVAGESADETGYIDGVGWVENFREMKETVTKLLEAHNLEQQAKRIAELEKERDSLLRLIGYVKSIVFSKVECSYASFKRPLEELLKEKEGGS
tara:strand:+ start:115 stop:546 length:432 start_codon:yes stop_codon:yes gene_type:complete